MPDVDTGQPARKAIWRAMLKPVAPSGLAQPISTSSTATGSMPGRSIALLPTCPPRVAPWVRLNAPRQDLVSAVRAVETMTASTAALLLAFLPRGILEAAALRRERREQRRGFPERRVGEP